MESLFFHFVSILYVCITSVASYNTVLLIDHFFLLRGSRASLPETDEKSTCDVDHFKSANSHQSKDSRTGHVKSWLPVSKEKEKVMELLFFRVRDGLLGGNKADSPFYGRAYRKPQTHFPGRHNSLQTGCGVIITIAPVHAPIFVGWWLCPTPIDYSAFHKLIYSQNFPQRCLLSAEPLIGLVPPRSRRNHLANKYEGCPKTWNYPKITGGFLTLHICKDLLHVGEINRCASRLQAWELPKATVAALKRQNK